MCIRDSNDHGHKGRNEHHTVKAVQNAAVPREDGAVILDAAQLHRGVRGIDLAAGLGPYSGI